MPETTPLIKAALNLRVGAGFDVYDHRTVFRQLQCPRGIQEDSTGGTEKIRASHEPDLRDTGQDRCAVF